MEVVITHLRKLAVSIKAKHKLHFDLVIPFLGIYQTEMHTRSYQKNVLEYL